MLSNSIERPNHSLSYSVGIDFCLQDADSLSPNITLECSLPNEPDPPPQFNFTVERTLLNSSSTEILQMQASLDSILKWNETVLQSLFSADTESITIICAVYNSFGGIFLVATSITICGMYIVQYGISLSSLECYGYPHACTQTIRF